MHRTQGWTDLLLHLLAPRQHQTYPKYSWQMPTLPALPGGHPAAPQAICSGASLSSPMEMGSLRARYDCRFLLFSPCLWKAPRSPRTHKCLLDAYISFPPYRMNPPTFSQLSQQKLCYVHPQSLSLLCLRLTHDFIFTDHKCWDFLSQHRGKIWTKDP